MTRISKQSQEKMSNITHLLYMHCEYQCEESQSAEKTAPGDLGSWGPGELGSWELGQKDSYCCCGYRHRVDLSVSLGPGLLATAENCRLFVSMYTVLMLQML